MEQFINETLLLCSVFSSSRHCFLSLLPLLPADVEVGNLNHAVLPVAVRQRNYKISATATLRSTLITIQQHHLRPKGPDLSLVAVRFSKVFTMAPTLVTVDFSGSGLYGPVTCRHLHEPNRCRYGQRY